MKYSELISAGYMARNDFNCAETMLNGANEHYEIGLDETALQVANGFGGGFGTERACGALTGGLMALGCLFATDRSHRDPRMKEIRNSFVGAFAKYYGSTECEDIKKTHRDVESGCAPVVAGAAKLLEKVIDEYKA